MQSKIICLTFDQSQMTKPFNWGGFSFRNRGVAGIGTQTARRNMQLLIGLFIGIAALQHLIGTIQFKGIAAGADGILKKSQTNVFFYSKYMLIPCYFESY